jgi:hypothetical protein
MSVWPGYSAWLRAGALVAAPLIVFVGCKDDRRAVVTEEQVEVCERGIESALDAPTVEEAFRTYYRGCANIFVEKDCRDAFVEAAASDTPQEIRSIVEPCRQVYCPLLADKGLELCMGGWLYEGPRLRWIWGELRYAIIELDAGELASRVNQTMLRFHTGVRSLPGAK